VRNRVAAVVAANDAGIATSGRYERGDHVIDPRSGRAATGLMSVTVIADTLAEADGCATAALAMGAAGVEWLGTIGAAAMMITDDQQVITTNRFRSYRRA
jgi:thiamine biosynthesis lipoprotein